MKKMKKDRALTKTPRAKSARKTERSQSAAGKARTEGLRLFKVAGRPSKPFPVRSSRPRARHAVWKQCKWQSTVPGF
jgi:hypothetical protein